MVEALLPFVPPSPDLEHPANSERKENRIEGWPQSKNINTSSTDNSGHRKSIIFLQNAYIPILSAPSRRDHCEQTTHGSLAST